MRVECCANIVVRFKILAKSVEPSAVAGATADSSLQTPALVRPSFATPSEFSTYRKLGFFISKD